MKGENLITEDELAKLHYQINELQKTKAIFQGLFQTYPYSPLRRNNMSSPCIQVFQAPYLHLQAFYKQGQLP